jgi:hypothetical protein
VEKLKEVSRKLKSGEIVMLITSSGMRRGRTTLRSGRRKEIARLAAAPQELAELEFSTFTQQGESYDTKLPNLPRVSERTAGECRKRLDIDSARSHGWSESRDMIFVYGLLLDIHESKYMHSHCANLMRQIY